MCYVFSLFLREDAMKVRRETKLVKWVVMKCDFCGACVGVCPTDAITLWEADLEIDEERCTECMRCVKICPYRALTGMDLLGHVVSVLMEEKS